MSISISWQEITDSLCSSVSHCHHWLPWSLRALSLADVNSKNSFQFVSIYFLPCVIFCMCSSIKKLKLRPISKAHSSLLSSISAITKRISTSYYQNHVLFAYSCCLKFWQIWLFFGSLLFGIYSIGMKTYIHKDLYPMFIIHNSQILETIQCPTSDIWVNKIWSTHITEYYRWTK